MATRRRIFSGLVGAAAALLGGRSVSADAQCGGIRPVTADEGGGLWYKNCQEKWQHADVCSPGRLRVTLDVAHEVQVQGMDCQWLRHEGLNRLLAERNL